MREVQFLYRTVLGAVCTSVASFQCPLHPWARQVPRALKAAGLYTLQWPTCSLGSLPCELGMETENVIVRTVQVDMSPNFLNLLSKHCTTCWELRLQRPHRPCSAQFSEPRAMNLVIDNWLQRLVHQWPWAQGYWNLQSQMLRSTLIPKSRVTFHCTVHCFYKGSFSQNLLTC